MSYNKSKCKAVAVIGGGASGLFAAAALADMLKQNGKKANITIYEANARVGKKLLATGNGRCNLTNTCVTADFYTGNTGLFNAVYSQFTNEQVLSFFKSAGMLTRTDFAGRIYPLSNQATSVLDTLRNEVARFETEIISETKITSVAPMGGGYIINGTYYADIVIIACGGKAAPIYGSDGSGYTLLKNMNVNVTPVYPALTPLTVEGFTKSLKGIRADGKITIKQNGSSLISARGELQYTDYGISGIPAMQVSYAASECFCKDNNASVFAVVDSAPDINEVELLSLLKQFIAHNPLVTAEMLLSGIMPKKLGSYLLSECSLNPQKQPDKLYEAVLNKLVSQIKCKKYKLSGVKGFDDAQVSAGGIAEYEVNKTTLMLNKHKGVYVCGELLGVTGTCGGYNLQWAWSSAYVAAKAILEEI